MASVTMVGVRSLVVAQICANDTSRGNASKPIFITDTNRVLFQEKGDNDFPSRHMHGGDIHTVLLFF